MGRQRPAEASRSVAKYLAPNESVVLELRQHWARVLPATVCCLSGFALVLLTGFLAPSSMGILTTVAWWMWLVLVAHWLWRLIEWWDESFVITNRRLILVHGIFIKKVAMMPLSKVTDMSYNRSLGARLLGYGTFVMESAGQEQALSTINFVRTPDAIYRQLCGLIFGDESDGQPSRATAESSADWTDDSPPTHEGWHDRWQDWSEDWSPNTNHSTTRTDGYVAGRPPRPVRSDTVPIEVRQGAGPLVDETDPYGLVTSEPFDAEKWPFTPYATDTDSSYDDLDDDSAWSVSHEHSTRPQPARRSRHTDPPAPW